jgi:hypothetical protein
MYTLRLYRYISKDFVGFPNRKLHPDLNEQLDQLKSHLKENSEVMAPLKVWQLQGMYTTVTVWNNLRNGRENMWKCVIIIIA